MTRIAFQNAVARAGGVITKEIRAQFPEEFGESPLAEGPSDAEAAAETIFQAANEHPDIVGPILEANGFTLDRAQAAFKKMLTEHEDLTELAAVIAEAVPAGPGPDDDETDDADDGEDAEADDEQAAPESAAATEAVPVEGEPAEETLADLRKRARELGVSFTKRATRERLIAEIAEKANG